MPILGTVRNTLWFMTGALSRRAVQLKRLATYAHLDLERGPVQQDALQKDLDAIIGCMRILQVGGLHGRVVRHLIAH